MVLLRSQSGFSLVELSIVLVILGLLTGGILAGQSLIRAAELKSVSTEYSRYAGAVQAFRDKYRALPGDMPDATQYWGSLGGAGNDHACQIISTPSNRATCSGNGDGVIGFPWVNCTMPGGTPTNTIVTRVSELTRFWQHLSNAGLIEGSYSGFANATPVLAPRPVTSPPNMPPTKFESSYWIPDGYPVGAPCAGSSSAFATSGRGPRITIMGATPFAVALPGSALIFNPQEMWNIDSKMDDGLPGRGRVTSSKTNCSTASGVAPPGDANAQYALSNSNRVCGIEIDL